jgi:hypothetical protein
MRRTTTSMQRDGRPGSPAAAAGRSRGRAWCWKGSGRARLDEAAPLLASLRVHSGSGRRGLKTWAYSVGVVSSRRDKLHKRCQSPQPLGQAPEPGQTLGGAREAITPALHVVGGGELNQRPLAQLAAKRRATLLGNNPAIGRISQAASNLVSAFCERSMSVSPTARR